MFSSLRARLWLSYAILIFIFQGLAAVLFLLYLWRNPILYRPTLERLAAVQTVILTRLEDPLFTQQEFETLLHNTDAAFDVRLVLVRNKQAVFDTRPDAAQLNLNRFPLPDRNLPLVRDADGQVWLYSQAEYANGLNLLALAPRENLPLLTLLRNELFAPFMRGGLLAWLFSLVLAYWIAHWISRPLQPLVSASQQIPYSDVQPVSVGGPREVQDVLRAFNAMLERVQANQKAQKEFVANVSHELKTPLTSVQGFAQAILDGTADSPESQRQSAQVIYNESGRMHRMVLDLLDLARMDSGMTSLEMAPLDVAALLQAVAEKFEPQARQMGVRLGVAAAGLPVLVGDGDRLSQVFTNLVDNALKFTPRGGQIQLDAQSNDGWVEISVTDTGQGIPPQAQAHIFDRFYQADESRKGGERHGAGLGLAICHEIVTAHGGKISVRSQPRQGSTFIVELPLAQEGASHQPNR
jgi:signal transduction histidine kinase